MPVLSAETPLKEDNEGLAKSADALNKKSDVSKHIEVQVAQETRTVSIGKLQFNAMQYKVSPWCLEGKKYLCSYFWECRVLVMLK